MRFYSLILKTPKKRLDSLNTLAVWFGIEKNKETAVKKAKKIYPEKRVISLGECSVFNLFYLLPFFNQKVEG